MLKTIPLVLFLAVIFQITHGQQKVTTNESQLWYLRSQNISDDLLKDAGKTKKLNEALYLAKLGNAWWKTDKAVADKYIEKAVDSIFFYTFKQDEAEDKNYPVITREILKLIGNKNIKQAKRLSKILSESSNFESSDQNANADSLIDLASKIVKENPQMAFELARTAFQIGHPKTFYKITWELREVNPGLADRLSEIILPYADKNRGFDTLNGLVYTAFPEVFIPNFPKKIVPSNSTKIKYLNFLSDHLSQQQIQFSAKISTNCDSSPRLLSSLLSQFPLLLPQKTEAVRQAINICSSNQNSSSQKSVSNPLSSLADKNVDELLKIAEETEAPEMRAVYFLKAAMLAHQNKDFEKAIEILDKMSDEEKEAVKQDWEEIRYDAATVFAAQKYEKSDFAGALEILDNVPESIKPISKITFVLQFDPEKTNSRPFFVELLNQSRKEILVSDKPFSTKTLYWLHLVKLFSRYQMPDDADSVFREVITEFNKQENTESNSELITDANIYELFPVELLEKNEISVLQTVQSINSINTKNNIRIGFLQRSLEKFLSLKEKEAKEKESKEKESKKTE